MTFTNHIIPFQLGESQVRGSIVRLETTVSEIIKRHNYPSNIESLLADTLTSKTSGGVGIPTREEAFRLITEQPLTRLAHDFSRFSVDQLHGLNPQGRFIEVRFDAVDRRAVQIPSQLVVTADQSADGVAHALESPDNPG